tara:strand:+ start:114 stop:1058 length:945 start_codon:yes stop_codon:yes gene_type:complete
MGSDYFGYGTAVQIVKESTWGTPVTPTKKLEVISSDLNSQEVRVPRPVLYTGTSGMSRKHHDTRDETGGAVVFFLKYSVLGYVLEAIFGSIATAGTGPYTHAYTLGAQKSLPALTIEEILGNSGNANTFAGMMVQSAEFNWSVGNPGGRLTCNFLGEDMTGPASETALTIDAGNVIEPYQAGQFNFNSVNYDLNSMTIRVDNGLDRRFKFGSLKTKQPVPVNMRNITVQIVLDVNDNFLTAQLADTQGDATLTFTGTGNEAAAWTFHNAWLESTSSPKTSHGMVELTVGFRLEDDDTDAGIKLVITNDQANHYD